MFCCLRTCLNGSVRHPPSSGHKIREPEIHLDAAHSGPEVILLSNQMRITGTGGALATAPLVQSKSYFEVKIQQSGCWSVGLATSQADLTKLGGGDKDSWCLCSDNATRHNGEVNRPVVNTRESNKPRLIGIEDLPDDTVVSKEPICSNGNLDPTTISQKQNDFPDEGDIIGVTYDHIELNFYFNGKNLEAPFRNVKGNVYPVVYVANGAIVDIILDKFYHVPPSGFDKIMIEQSLL